MQEKYYGLILVEGCAKNRLPFFGGIFPRDFWREKIIRKTLNLEIRIVICDMTVGSIVFPLIRLSRVRIRTVIEVADTKSFFRRIHVFVAMNILPTLESCTVVSVASFFMK